jgi:drug/metabolite transporter (DMT)-like permease
MEKSPPGPSLLAVGHKASRVMPIPLGYGLLLLAVILNALGFHAGRAALEGSSPLMVSLLICLGAVLLFWCLGVLARCSGQSWGGMDAVSSSRVWDCIRTNQWLLLPLTLLLSLSTWLVLTSLGLYGASTTAFLLNLTLIILVMAGCLMGERLRCRELLAIVIMLGGVFLFTYRGDGFLWGAWLLMVIACAVTAMKQLLVKHLSGDWPLPVVMVAVLLLSLPWTVALTFGLGQWHVPSLGSIVFSLLSALLCNVGGMSLLYQAYNRVGVARGAPFDALRPLAVLVIGVPLGYALPGLLSLAGGVLILLGSVALTLSSQKSSSPAT